MPRLIRKDPESADFWCHQLKECCNYFFSYWRPVPALLDPAVFFRSLVVANKFHEWLGYGFSGDIPRDAPYFRLDAPWGGICR